MKANVYKTGPNIFGEVFWRVVVEDPLEVTKTHSFNFLQEDVAESYASYLTDLVTETQTMLRHTKENWKLGLEHARITSKGLTVGS